MLVWCFLAPSLGIFLLYRLIPLVWNAALSFSYWSPMKGMKWAGVDQYEDMIHDDVFWQALWNTLIFIASAPVTIVIAFQGIRGDEIFHEFVNTVFDPLQSDRLRQVLLCPCLQKRQMFMMFPFRIG